MKTMKYMLMALSLAGVLSINAQSLANQPSSEFQSTSSMVGSGSSYASNPSLNADGTAAYNSPSYAPQRAISGPNRIAPVTPEGDPTPVGDALIPLLLLALFYGLHKMITKKVTPTV